MQYKIETNAAKRQGDFLILVTFLVFEKPFEHLEGVRCGSSASYVMSLLDVLSCLLELELFLFFFRVFCC